MATGTQQQNSNEYGTNQFTSKNVNTVIKKVSKVDITPTVNIPHATLYLGDYIPKVLMNEPVKGKYVYNAGYENVSALFFVIAEAFNLDYKISKVAQKKHQIIQMLTYPYFYKYSEQKKYTHHSYLVKNAVTLDTTQSLDEVKKIILTQTKAEQLGYIPAWLLVYSPGLSQKKLIAGISEQIAFSVDGWAGGDRPKIDQKQIKKIVDVLLKDDKPKIIDIFPYLDFLIPSVYDDYEKKLMLQLLSFEAEQKMLYQTYLYKKSNSSSGKNLVPRGGRFHYLDGDGAIKFDFYEHQVDLPPNLTYGQWIEGFATKANIFLDTKDSKNPYTLYSEFSPWKTNGGAKAQNPKVASGDIMDLQIYGPNNGSIMITDVKTDAGIDSQVTFSTMSMEELIPDLHNMSKLTQNSIAGTTGDHIVSGNRIWGFRKKMNRKKDNENAIYCYTIGLSKVIEQIIATPGETVMYYASKILHKFDLTDGATKDAGGIQNLNWICFHIANVEFLSKAIKAERRKAEIADPHRKTYNPNLTGFENFGNDSAIKIAYSDGKVSYNNTLFPKLSRQFYRNFNISPINHRHKIEL